MIALIQRVCERDSSTRSRVSCSQPICGVQVDRLYPAPYKATRHRSQSKHGGGPASSNVFNTHKLHITKTDTKQGGLPRKRSVYVQTFAGPRSFSIAISVADPRRGSKPGQPSGYSTGSSTESELVLRADQHAKSETDADWRICIDDQNASWTPTTGH